MDIKVVICSHICIKSGDMFTWINAVICPKMDENLVIGPKTCQIGNVQKDVKVVIAKKVCKSGNMSKERM